MKLFGILNKEQGMMKLNDEGTFFAQSFVYAIVCVLARVPRVSLPFVQGWPRKSEAVLRFTLI
jgi:hypothetical protein